MRAMPGPEAASVDTLDSRSVSFAAPELPARHRSALISRAPVPVGPGRPALVAPLLDLEDEGAGVSRFRAQPGKVQRPPVRDDTLARDRLLDWLHAKIHHRVVLISAEAGYGKTTLLADFSRRTRLRTLWYRLDESDANWVSFIGHLAAAGREIDAAFAPATDSLLAEVGIAGPSRDAVVDTFIREIEPLGDGGAVIVLDDYHAVEESEDVRYIMRRLLAAAPERVTFVLASRRLPALPLGRARAQGEVAELSTEDLRFDTTETERLFREAYGHPLEPDVLAELSRRTEGWAASLQLVRTAIHDRSGIEVRSFVESLTGARGDMYDYLAEEVVGDLPRPLQTFLMHAALLLVVDVQSAATAAGLSLEEARPLLDAAERIGILSRRTTRFGVSRGFHPLVREFLEDRLRAEVGDAGFSALRRSLGHAAEATDWRTAVHHFAEAGDVDEIQRVVASALGVIMGTGQDTMAIEILDARATEAPSSASEVLRSRVALRRGDTEKAKDHALRARALAPANTIALMNLMSTSYTLGELDDAILLAADVLDQSEERMLRTMAEVLATGVKSSQDYNLEHWRADLEKVAREQASLGHRHFEGVAFLNAANVLRAEGLAAECLSASQRALMLLTTTSGGEEVASAHLTKAWALAHLGRLEEARAEMREARRLQKSANTVEILTESADVELWYGEPLTAVQLLYEAMPSSTPHRGYQEALRATRAEAALVSDQLEDAATLVSGMQIGHPSLTPGLKARQLALRAHLALVTHSETADAELEAALNHARSQSASFWVAYLQALDATRQPPNILNRWLHGLPKAQQPFLSILADRIGSRLADLDDAAVEVLASEASLRPERWRFVLRRVMDNSLGPASLPAARVLDRIGDVPDIARLRAAVKRLKGISTPDQALGRGLARRLAPRVEIRDLGRVAAAIGPRVIAGSDIRRKVLALVCYLVTRPGFSAARDEVVDALWPNLDPEVALNSLNQTVYFLRRVFEPGYQEDLSPQYVHHDSDVLWLDRELVRATSTECAALLGRPATDHTAADTDQLSQIYAGKFALDFAYEEWAVPYRDRLHAAYLHAIEDDVHADTMSGNFARGIRLARRALEIDPEAEHLELCLLRLYRLSGAHAAAAEQYAHYASVLRDDLGIDPPPLESI